MSNHSVPVEDIWLIREGGESETGHAVVYVKIAGVWRKAISELMDGSFSHNITSHGLADERHCPPVEWMNRVERAEEERA